MDTVRSGTEWFRVDDSNSAGAVRRAATGLSTRLGFGEARTGEVGIVATEAVSNVWRHAGHGTAAVQVALRHGRPGVQIITVDDGPGMADIPLSVTDGHSTHGTLGVGLGAIVRLSSRVDISSQPGHGTVLVAELWADQDPPDGIDVGAVTRPIAGEELCGDIVGARQTDGHHVLMLADGLGHGPLAAKAAAAALTAFHDSPSVDPVAILTHMHARIGHTRGAAVAVAVADPAFDRLAFAGVGNVATVVDDGTRRRGAPSQPGIVGHNLGKILRVDLDLAPGAVLALHSDGVRETWTLRDVPGLSRRDATVIAATVLRNAGTRPDDASVLVARRRR